jgi:hypothetical protein
MWKRLLLALGFRRMLRIHGLKREVAEEFLSAGELQVWVEEVAGGNLG